MALPLAGVRVLDLASMMAGPYGATLLGDMGADVIKIEPPTGDEARLLGPKIGNDSGAFVGINRNKRGMVLDLTQPKGREVYFRLIKTADVVVENIRPPAKAKLGIGYEETSHYNPGIIYISVSTFGQSGPYAGRPGIDPLAQALSGFMSITGERHGRPLKAGPAVADATCANLVAFAAVVGLWVRDKQGIGQQIEVCLIDGLIHIQAPQVGQYFLCNYLQPRVGNASPYYAPAGSFVCRDGRAIQIAILNSKFFRNFCRAIKREELADDPRFRTNEARMKNREELEGIVRVHFAQKDFKEMMHGLIECDVIAAPIYTHQETFSDPQVLYNQMVVEVEHARVGKLTVGGVPVKLTKTPGRVRLAPPTLGQHTREILQELGYTDKEIGDLLEQGVIQ